jgi:alkyl hydroperoxide reductase subunit AhpF
MVSTERTGLDPGLEIMVKTIADSVHLQIMVTLTCPHCQKMVQVAHQLAFLNNKIQADMVELTEFPNLALRYNVTGTPKTIINELYSFVGAVPAEQAYLEILKAVNPQEYQHLKKEVTQA